MQSAFNESRTPSTTSGRVSAHCETFAADREASMEMFYRPVCLWVISVRSESCDS